MAMTARRRRLRRPPLIMASQSRQARRHSCSANHSVVPAGAIMPLRPAGPTSARKVSSRLARSPATASAPGASFLPAWQPQFVEGAFGDEPAVGDDADAVGHALGDFENMRGHDDGAAGAHPFAQHAFDLTRRAGVEPGQRFVENDQPRFVNERTGQRNFLPHALGKSFAAFAAHAAPDRASPEALARAARQAPARGPTIRRRIRDIPAASACRRSSAHRKSTPSAAWPLPDRRARRSRQRGCCRHRAAAGRRSCARSSSCRRRSGRAAHKIRRREHSSSSPSTAGRSKRLTRPWISRANGGAACCMSWQSKQ